MPMQRRLPKVGFKNPFRVSYFAVNLADIEERCAAGTISVATLKDLGLVPRSQSRVKVLGTGDVTKAFVVQAQAFSASAQEKLEKAGGRAEVVGV
jgi:large subunit ribosomal protein L15